ncbi:alpha-hydroxy acid oxidase [Streptomyces sp. WI04-05B]|uniref:alpha-hydroxy acid oxidase n=1 Tax=Streptomyces TaxID=1883 RepID=UPI0029BA2B46|nr:MULTISPECIES: alpha-hydroxy acid oxidase [unclassified Streptomyces]MDX2547634.1 alpha-hydroxy acid oxidase [Streptomyces sp. WI04-05B]MDX2590110.1 alpha-hydroxy acid oxidase [Streptomyces sp. WI04-05A]
MTIAGSPRILELADAAAAARQILPTDVWDFIEGGSGAETTLAENRAFLDRTWVTPRVLAGATHAETADDLLGTPVSMPLGIAPMAYQSLVHPDGELALARAARSAGTLFVVSTMSSHSVERIAETGARLWFQLYWLRDRAKTAELIGRAVAAGCRALVLTLDVPVMGRRLRDMRNAFALPSGLTAAHFTEDSGSGLPGTARRSVSGSSALMVHTAAAIDPSLSWADLGWIRERTRIPLVLKGILSPKDADRAAAMGVDAIVVSNHGGRQLDGAPPAASALPAVVRTVAGRCPVYLDSGIRSGADMVKALALGAKGVLLGRPALWGLAMNGEEGAGEVLDLLRSEFEDALLLAGCSGPVAAGRLTVTTGGAPPRTEETMTEVRRR